MTIEEKAKRYDEAIEKLRSLHDDYDTVSTLINIKEELENIFPELKESEGEGVRKALITYFQRFPYDLEGAGINAKDAIAWLEKQGEQKPADKVEPKFKPGDWVIRKNGAAFRNGSICARVQNIEGHKVWFEHGTYADEAYLVKIRT